MLISTHHVKDVAPKRRNERTIMDFVRRRDEYEAPAKARACCA